MKILSLHIDGFGKFHDRDISFEDGLNVVYGKNAKITWDSNNTMGQISIGNNATAITGHGGQERALWH